MPAITSQHSEESIESLDLFIETGSSSFEEMEDVVPLGTHPNLRPARMKNLTSNPPQSLATKTDWENLSINSLFLHNVGMYIFSCIYANIIIKMASCNIIINYQQFSHYSRKR